MFLVAAQLASTARSPSTACSTTRGCSSHRARHHRRHRRDGPGALAGAGARRVHLRPCSSWRHAAVTHDAAAVRVDRRLRDREPDRAVGRARARQRQARRRVRVPRAYAFFQLPHGLFAVSIMTTMQPELASSFVARQLAGVPVPVRAWPAPHPHAHDPGRRRCTSGSRSRSSWRCSNAARSRPHDARSWPTRSPASASACPRSPLYLYVAARRTTRCRTPARRSSSTASRTRSTSGSRSSSTPPSASPGWPGRSRAPTRSPRS